MLRHPRMYGEVAELLCRLGAVAGVVYPRMASRRIASRHVMEPGQELARARQPRGLSPRARLHAVSKDSTAGLNLTRLMRVLPRH